MSDGEQRSNNEGKENESEAEKPKKMFFSGSMDPNTMGDLLWAQLEKDRAREKK